MNLSFGQLLGGAGIVANRMRATENDIMQQRELQLRTQELNRLNEIRARMGEDANAIANAPIPEFVTQPGTMFGTQPPAGTPAAPAANAPAPAPANAPVRPAAGLNIQPFLPQTGAPRSPDVLKNVPTNQMTAVEFQSLPENERLLRLQNVNRERQAAIDRAQFGKAPAVAADIAAGGPWNAVAGGLTWAGNALGVPRIGRALGIYDSDVTRVEVPKVGTGTATPYYDMIRQVEQANQPMTEAQLLASMKKSEQDKYLAAKQKAEADIKAAPQTFAKWEQKFNLPAGLLNAVMMAESGGNPGQTSRAGAQGYFQFMPDTAAQYKVKVNDLNSEAEGAARMLSDLMKMTNGDLQSTLAAYNWGIGKVQRHGIANMPAETRKYIPKVMSYLGGAPTGTAAAPGTAPAINVASAVQTGTPQQVADAASKVVPVEPAKGGTMYGSATIDPSARNPLIQQALQQRAILQKQVALFNQYGMGDKAIEAATKIQALDLGLYKNQADLGVYEGTTTGNYSRALSVLSTFTNAPHQVLQRQDGNFDLYINGKVAKAGLSGAQIEMLVRTQVDASYKQQLAALQAEQAKERFKTDEEIRKETGKQVLQTAREIQLKLTEGNVKMAEEKLKASGFKLVGSGAGDGKAYYANGLGDIFIVDGTTKQVTINGTTVDTGPQAQRVSGVDRSIWSSVNAPQAQ